MVRLVVRLCSAVVVLAAAVACSSGSSGTTAPTGSSAASTSATNSAGSTSSAAPSTSAGSGGAASPGPAAGLPQTCQAIPPSVMLPYARVTLVRSFPRSTPGVTCEFASAGARQIVILTVGPGSPTSFAQLEASTRLGGVTTATLPGLGQRAFTISRAGKVAGVDVLTTDDVTIALGAALPTGQVQRLAAKLVARY